MPECFTASFGAARLRTACAILACCAVSSQVLLASEDDIEELLVTASRLPTAGAALAADRVVVDAVLNAYQGTDFAEALKAVPGLFVQSRYNAAQDLRIDLRGFGARGNFGIRGIRVFVDGMPAGLPDGQVEVDSLDPAEISSIEILRGPAAARYGNGAGGVILIETRDPASAPPWQLSFGLGENGFSQQSGSAVAQQQDGALAARLTYSRLSLDGHRQQSRSDHRRLAAQMQVRISENSHLQVRARTTDAPISEDPGGLRLEDFLGSPRAAAAGNLRFDAGERLDQQSLAWRWRHRGKANGRLELSNYFSWRDFENRLPFTDGGAVTIDRRLGGIGAQYRFDTAGRGSWILGTEFHRQADHRRRFDNQLGRRGRLRLDQDERVAAAGAWVGAEFSRASFALQTALRFDSVNFDLRDAFMADGDDSGDRRFNRWSQGLGLRWEGREGLLSYLRFATAFDTPTTTELANPLGAGFNQRLEPQTSTAWELGLRSGKASGRRRAELAIYQIDTRDELIAFELPASPGRSFYTNAGKSRRRGAELALAMRAAEHLDLRFSAAWSDALFRRFESGAENFAGKQLPGTPGLRIAGSLDYRLGDALRLGLDAERVSDVYADNANTVASPAYLDMGLRAAWATTTRRARVECYLGVKNLLDEKYPDNLRINAFGGRYYEPAPGRYFYGGLRLSGLP